MRTVSLGLLFMIAIATVAACKSTNYKADASSVTPLTVAFADPSWIGKKVPAGQR
jgi:hypothetical protein